MVDKALQSFIKLIMICSALVCPSAAQNCFPAATWPKLIGYGKSDTEVVSIDRRDSDGMLALVVATGEDDLVGIANSSSDSRAYMTFDTATETYKWFKVFSGVNTDFPSFVYFTPDGSKVLAAQFIGSDRTMVYMDAETGV